MMTFTFMYVCWRIEDRSEKPIGVGDDECACWLSAEAWIRRHYPQHIEDFGKSWPIDDRSWRDRFRLLTRSGYTIRRYLVEKEEACMVRDDDEAAAH